MTRTVLDKLGFKAGDAGAVIDPPPKLAPLFASVTPGSPVLFTLAFVRDGASLAAVSPSLADGYEKGARLWVAYPKKSGAIRSDLNRDAGWEPLQSRGFLPVTQVAIDDDWSALRWRLRDEIPKLTRRNA